mgnify:CR=1 FL=1
MAKVGKLKVDIYDITAGDTDSKRVLFDTEEWTVQTPILAFSDVVDLKYNNPALATGEQINLFDLINGLKVAADKKKWTDLTLKDAVGNKYMMEPMILLKQNLLQLHCIRRTLNLQVLKLISLKQTRLNTAMLTVSLLGMANLQVLFMSMMFNSSSLILTTGVL